MWLEGAAWKQHKQGIKEVRKKKEKRADAACFCGGAVTATRDTIKAGEERALDCMCYLGAMEILFNQVVHNTGFERNQI